MKDQNDKLNAALSQTAEANKALRSELDANKQENMGAMMRIGELDRRLEYTTNQAAMFMERYRDLQRQQQQALEQKAQEVQAHYEGRLAEAQKQYAEVKSSLDQWRCPQCPVLQHEINLMKAEGQRLVGVAE